MKKNKKELGISPTLKKLDKYGKASFPLVKQTSVDTTIQRIQTASNKKFEQKRDNETGLLWVTRTA